MDSNKAANMIAGIMGMALLAALFLVFRAYVAGETGQTTMEYLKGFGLPAVLSVIILLASIILRHVLFIFLDYLLKDYSPSLMKLSRTMVSMLLIFITLILITAVFTQDHLILSVVVAGVLAIALISSRNAMEDFIARLQLLLNPLIDIGDYIEVEGEKGKVIEFGLIYTAIRRHDKKIVLIPNKEFTNKKVINYSKSPHLRVQDCVELGVSMREALKIVKKLEQALEDEGFDKQRAWLSQEGDKMKIFACIDIDDPAKIQQASNELTKQLRKIATQHGAA